MGQFILERLDVYEHSKCSDKSCGEETCLPSLNLSFPKLNRLPGLLIPQSIHKQPLGWLQRIESKLRVTLQALQNVASTCPCRLHSHHDPKAPSAAARPSCATHLPARGFPCAASSSPSPCPSSDEILLISPCPAQMSSPLGIYSSLWGLSVLFIWQEEPLPFVMSLFPECGACVSRS